MSERINNTDIATNGKFRAEIRPAIRIPQCSIERPRLHFAQDHPIGQLNPSNDSALLKAYKHY